MPSYPANVRIVEVGPRDGLQNESAAVPTAAKIRFIAALTGAGLRHIEATSFVNPKVIPQLADAEDLVKDLPLRPGVVYSALTPNERGLDRALAAGVRRVAVFTAVSETFNRKNIAMSVDQSLDVFRSLVRRALEANMTVRGYLSTAFVCPYEGRMEREQVLLRTRQLLELGVDEVAVSDTLGAAVPTDVFETVGLLLSHVPKERVALHFHDTYGTALANVLAGLELGITTYDASAGGLGGCPFAPGASGNLATEDLVYMLDKMNITTGVDLERVVDAADEIARVLGRALPSSNWRRLKSGKCSAV